MSTALSVPTTAETKWTILSGAMKGSVRLMNLPSFTIGRSPECDLVIVSDPKCSRKQAQVQCTPKGYEIVCLNENNLLLINKKEVARSHLNDGDIVILGETEVQFNVTSLPLLLPKAPQEPLVKTVGGGGGTGSKTPTEQGGRSFTPTARETKPGSTQTPQFHQVTPTPRQPAPALGVGSEASQAGRAPGGPFAQTAVRPYPQKRPFPGRLVIYFALALFIVFIFIDNAQKKKKEVTIRSEESMKADIDAALKLKESADQMPKKRFDQSVSAQQAQENFVRGFRDYHKGQFERALDSFQACLALDPAHVLCNHYLLLAQRRFNEMIQYYTVLGRKYRDQNQFKACRSAFRNVMMMVKDQSRPEYVEAKANYDACNSLVEGRF